MDNTESAIGLAERPPRKHVEQLLQLKVTDVIVPEHFNPRMDMGDMKELEHEIKAAGRVYSPIFVEEKDGKYEVVDGARRTTVAKALKLDTIPAILIRTKDDNEKLVRAIVANGGKPLLPVEEGLAFKRIVDGSKLKARDIAKMIGKGLQHVEQRLQLAEAAPEVQDAVRKRKVSADLGAAITRKSKGDKKKQAALAKKATSGTRGRKQVEVITGAANAAAARRDLQAESYRKILQKEISAFNAKQEKDDRIAKTNVDDTIKTLSKRFRKRRGSEARIAYLVGVINGAAGKV